MFNCITLTCASGRLSAIELSKNVCANNQSRLQSPLLPLPSPSLTSLKLRTTRRKAANAERGERQNAGGLNDGAHAVLEERAKTRHKSLTNDRNDRLVAERKNMLKTKQKNTIGDARQMASAARYLVELLGGHLVTIKLLNR